MLMQERSLRDTAIKVYKKNKSLKEELVYPEYCSYKDKAILYYILFRNKSSGNCLYKIGFTITSLETRLNRMGVRGDYSVKVLQTLSGASKDIYFIEQMLHKEWKKFIYCGEGFLLNGMSEVYVKDVLGLNNGSFEKKFKLLKKDLG